MDRSTGECIWRTNFLPIGSEPEPCHKEDCPNYGEPDPINQVSVLFESLTPWNCEEMDLNLFINELESLAKNHNFKLIRRG